MLARITDGDTAMGKAILRFVLGALAGLVVMYLVIMGVEQISRALYPLPAGIDPTNMAHIPSMIDATPPAGLAIIVLAWVFGALAGGFVAAKISSAWPRSAAIVVACFVVIGVVGMIMVAPNHPKWMSILGILLPVPMALIGARFARSKAIPSP
jgi:hypothetical protein